MGDRTWGSVPGHNADAGKHISGTGTRGGKFYMPFCSCGWRSSETFNRHERAEAIGAMQRHLEEASK